MSTRRQLLQQWDHQLRALLPGVRATRVATLALFSLGLLWAGSVTLLRVAATLPVSATDLSRVRRLRRWLANSAIAVGALWPPLLTALLAAHAGQDRCLVYDPTPLGTRLTVLVLGLVVHKRILPVAWHPMPQQTIWPVHQATVLRRLTRQVARCLPADCTITLLADRGVTGAELIDCCRARAWHFVFRVSASAGSSPTVRLADGTACPLWSLVTGPGQRWTGEISLYQAAGWRTVNLTIHWARGADEPWLLISDQPAGVARVREYRRRVHCEATYADTKVRGWNLEHTKLTDRARLNRLLFALYLALWWAETLGLRVVRRGLRHCFDRADRRDLSLVRLGRRWLTELLERGHLPPLLFRNGPTGWRLAYQL